MDITIDSTGVQETQTIAERLGMALRGGETIELTSDLGGGKTTFVHGLAKAINSPDRVASPTFTISKVYKGERLEIHHFDFYRLQDAGLMEHELHDVLGDPQVVVVVEWGGAVAHVLPEDRLTIRLTRTGDESRCLELSCPDNLAYLLEGLK